MEICALSQSNAIPAKEIRSNGMPTEGHNLKFMACDNEMLLFSAIQKLREFDRLQYPRKLLQLWVVCTTMGVQTRSVTWFTFVTKYMYLYHTYSQPDRPTTYMYPTKSPAGNGGYLLRLILKGRSKGR